MKLALLDIVEDTMVDGPGMRTAIYCAGCSHHCPGCHNPLSWEVANGHWVEVDEVLRVVLADPFADVTFSGGDPMEQAEAFAELAEAIRARSTKTIWCYTGYTYEQLLHRPAALALLRRIDVLVDGPFLAALRNPGLRFRGSGNQRIIDVKASLRGHQVVEMVL